MADDQFIRGAGMLAVLKVLERGELYGYAIVEAPGDALHLEQSTVYPMLYNLEGKGLVRSRWDESGARPRKYYTLTAAGRKRLAADSDQWKSVTAAMEALGLGRLAITRVVTACC
jgi:PadR family transcriptional regulator PadR